jgi:ketosteroid isomerase-like protein
MNPRSHKRCWSIVLLAMLSCTLLVRAQSATVPSTRAATAGIDHLRDAIKSAYSAGDIDAMLRYVHPDCLVIFPDGEILKGRDELKNYLIRMTKAPDKVVASYTAEPEVLSRTVHGDVALSYGKMHDHYVLTDGKEFTLDSRFSVTVFKSIEGPSETDGWMIRSFHSSSDVFDNAIIRMAAKKVAVLAGSVAFLVGAVVAITGMVLLRRRQMRAQPDRR